MRFSTQFSSLAKSAFAALILLLAASGVKAQTAYLTNFTNCDMDVEITGFTNCIPCTTFTVIVPANTTTAMAVPTGCAGAVKAKVLPTSCPSTAAALVETYACQCSAGSITDQDCFYMTSSCCEPVGTVILVGAQCYLSDMYVTITTGTSCP